MFVFVRWFDDVPAYPRWVVFLYCGLELGSAGGFYFHDNPAAVLGAADPMVTMYDNLSFPDLQRHQPLSACATASTGDAITTPPISTAPCRIICTTVCMFTNFSSPYMWDDAGVVLYRPAWERYAGNINISTILDVVAVDFYCFFYFCLLFLCGACNRRGPPYSCQRVYSTAIVSHMHIKCPYCFMMIRLC